MTIHDKLLRHDDDISRDLSYVVLMKNAFLRSLIIFLTCLSFGFQIDTPESIREHEKEVRRWQKQIKKAYDLKALHAFLGEQIKAHPVVEGIDLGKAKVTKKWITGDRVLSCGDWYISLYATTDAEFTISWTYENIPNTKTGEGIWKQINFICHRKSKDSFELVSATRTEEEYIELSP